MTLGSSRFGYVVHQPPSATGPAHGQPEAQSADAIPLIRGNATVGAAEKFLKKSEKNCWQRGGTLLIHARAGGTAAQESPERACCTKNRKY